jgi:hypothetical protein
MPDIVELRSAAERLRLWAREIRRENMPSPYAGADEDMRMLEKVATLLDEAADEINRLRASPNND